MKLTFQHEIGIGGFGVVDMVTDEKGNPYARKTFRINNPAFPRKLEGNARERFVREVKYQGSIQHKNIVPILYSDLNGDSPFYLMPVALGSLQDEIEKDRTLNGEFLECLLSIMAGLEEIHSMRIYHRDLKPANVLRFADEDGLEFYALGDFGLIAIDQTRISTITQTGMRMGSDYYTAPEIVSELKDASVQSDIFSLGCILHDFVGNNRRVPNYEINEQGVYGGILRGCTRKEPARRFKSVAAVRDAILSVEETKVQPATKEGAEIAQLLISKTDLSETEWQLIVEFIGDNIGNEDGISVIWTVTIQHITEIATTLPNLGAKLGRLYAEWVRRRSFPFGECDGIAVRLEAFVTKCDVDVQAECLMAMLYMGTSHNRWYVERKFAVLTGKLIASDLAKRLSLEIRVDGQDACRAYTHLTHSIKYSYEEAHPLLSKTIKEICK